MVLHPNIEVFMITWKSTLVTIHIVYADWLQKVPIDELLHTPRMYIASTCLIVQVPTVRVQ